MPEVGDGQGGDAAQLGRRIVEQCNQHWGRLDLRRLAHGAEGTEGGGADPCIAIAEQPGEGVEGLPGIEGRPLGTLTK